MVVLNLLIASIVANWGEAEARAAPPFRAAVCLLALPGPSSISSIKQNGWGRVTALAAPLRAGEAEDTSEEVDDFAAAWESLDPQAS
jgi:hypothetical protein